MLQLWLLQNSQDHNIIPQLGKMLLAQYGQNLIKQNKCLGNDLLKEMGDFWTVVLKFLFFKQAEMIIFLVNTKRFISKVSKDVGLMSFLSMADLEPDRVLVEERLYKPGLNYNPIWISYQQYL